RVIGRALKREIESDFQAVLARERHELAEIVQPAELRVHRAMSAFLAPYRPGTAGIARLRALGVVAALAVGAPDRMHRRQVHDIEAHARRRAQARLTIAQPAVHRRIVRAGTRKELVPGAEARQLAIDDDAKLGRERGL